MLGSPLNMAPEVLGGKKYSSKADIWSIGVCFYEMLYGRPPYSAKSLVELLKKIKSTPIYFPSKHPVDEVVKDVLRKMLVLDTKKRISWNELFNHKINSYLEDKVKE